MPFGVRCYVQVVFEFVCAHSLSRVRGFPDGCSDRLADSQADANSNANDEERNQDLNHDSISLAEFCEPCA